MPPSAPEEPALPPSVEPGAPVTPPEELKPAGPEVPGKGDPKQPEAPGEEPGAGPFEDPETPEDLEEITKVSNTLSAPAPVNAPEAEEGEIRSITVSPVSIENGGTVTVTVEMYYPQEQMDNRVVYVKFMHTEDNPLREFSAKCYRQEEPGAPEDHIYHFVGTIDVKPYASSGTYKLEYLDDWVNDQDYCSDRYREHHFAYSSTLFIPSGWQPTFTVDNKFSADTAPILEAIEAGTSAVTLNGAPQTIDLRLKVKVEGLAEISDIDGAVANFEYPDKQLSFRISDFSSQPDQNGFYTAALTVPAHASAGNYRLAYLSIEDQNENYRVYYASPYAEDYENEEGAENISSDLGKVLFEIVNPQEDNTAPILEGISIAPETIELGQTDSVILTLQVSDGDGSGFDPYSPEDSIALRDLNHGDGPPIRATYIDDNSCPPGTYRYSISLRHENVIQNITYYVKYVYVADFAGNRVRYWNKNFKGGNPDDPELPDVTLTVGKGSTDPWLPDDENANPLIWYGSAALKFPGQVPESFKTQRMSTDRNSAIVTKYNASGGARLAFYDFKGHPVVPDGPAVLTLAVKWYMPSIDCYIYSIGGNNTLTDITSNFTYVTESDIQGRPGWTSTVSSLGAYVISDKKLVTPSGGGGSANVNLIRSATVTKSTTTAVSNAIAAAKKAGLTSTIATVTVKTGTEISPQTVRAIVKAANAAAANKGVAVNTLLSIENWKVDRNTGKNVLNYRASFDPAKWTAATNLKFSLRTDDLSVRTAFEKIYVNQMAIIRFDQKGSLGMPVTITVKPDLSKLNTQTLYFYAYDQTSKSITQIAAPNYWFDKSGYLHFTTTMGNHVIITDRPLVKK